MCFQNLADVHTSWHPQGIEDDLHRRTISQKGHILSGHHFGDDALITVATSHLVTFGDFALLGHTDLHQLVNASGKITVLFPAKELYVNYLAFFAMRKA